MGTASLHIVMTALVVIFLALPMAFRLIPKNKFYGFRARRSVGSDEEWYRSNQTAGIAMVIAGFVTILSAVLVPRFVADDRTVTVVCTGVLFLSLFIAIGYAILRQSE